MNIKQKAKIKLLYEDSKIPEKREEDIGWDVFVHSFSVENGVLIYKTGISITPPEGYYFEFFPRSSQSKVPFVFCNSVGVIDPGFTGELQVRLRPVGNIIEEFELDGSTAYFLFLRNGYRELPFTKGDRIGQLILKKENKFEWEISDSLEISERGEGGFGSTGK